MIGFSTGAVSFGNFASALRLLRQSRASAVELSALRHHELAPLIDALGALDVDAFHHVSVHVPSSFLPSEEDEVIRLLEQVPGSWPIIVHPTVIYHPDRWQGFGPQLAIENMDRRRYGALTCRDMTTWFERMPYARMCFDMAHAHQVDPSMAEAGLMLVRFFDRMTQVHLSQLDATGAHYPLTPAIIDLFARVIDLVPTVPVILESVNPVRDRCEAAQVAWIDQEIGRAELLLRQRAVALYVGEIAHA